MLRTPLRLATACAASAALVTLAACAPPSTSTAATSAASAGAAGAGSSASGSSTTSAASATSAQQLGGMDALVSAAKAEGSLNVIALPPDWTDYGDMIAEFQSTYGIKVTSSQPDASSQEEVDAAKRLGSDSRAPDVFDLGQSVTQANTSLFAPYEVSTWSTIPANLKDPSGTWVNDYAGTMSIGYDSSKVATAPTSVKDLMGDAYKGKVALNGDPTKAGAAFSGVMMASLGNGGSASDIAPGVSFFKDLKAAGNFLPVDPTEATITSGQTPVVIDWDYNNTAVTKELPSWKVVVPTGAVLSSYYDQAISKTAPHPAAARLWEEFLYSDQGQNTWLKGGGRPVRIDAMQQAGTLDQAALAALPAVSGTPVVLTAAQARAGAAVLSSTWAAAVS